jgi:hypothetical protein
MEMHRKIMNYGDVAVIGGSSLQLILVIKSGPADTSKRDELMRGKWQKSADTCKKVECFMLFAKHCHDKYELSEK